MNISNNSITNSQSITKKALIGAGFVIPAVYITKNHMDMYNKNDKLNRKKMLNKMVGFFSGVGISVLLTHQKIKSPENKILKQSMQILGATAAPFMGLWGAKKLNKELDF